jgi:hypothetical protein
MRLQRLHGFMLLLGSMLALSSNAQPMDSKVQQAVNQVLDHHYGQQWDQANDCRRFHTPDGAFCMQLVQIEPITIAKQQYLYVMSAGEAYSAEAKLGENGHAQHGLGGLFVLVHTAQGWQTTAAAAVIETGQWGVPQIDQLKLTQIGAKRWGWVGRMGGSGAGGESNEQWLVYAPLGRVVKEIANLDAEHDYANDEYREETSTQFRWRVQQPMDAGFYRIVWSRQVVKTPMSPDGEPIQTQAQTRRTQGIARFDRSSMQFKTHQQNE